MNATRSIGVLVALAAFGGLASAPAASAICQESGTESEVKLYASYDGAQKGSVRVVNATRGLLGAPVVVDSMRALTVASRPAPGWSVATPKPFTLMFRGSSRVVDVTRGPDDARVIAMWRKRSGQVGCTYVKVAKASTAPPTASVVPVVTGGLGSLGERGSWEVRVSNPKGRGAVEVVKTEVIGGGWWITNTNLGTAFTVPVGGSVWLYVGRGPVPGTLRLTLKDGTVVTHEMPASRWLTKPFQTSLSIYTADTVTLAVGMDHRGPVGARVTSVEVPEVGGWKQIGGYFAPFQLDYKNELVFARGTVDSVAVVTFSGAGIDGYQIRIPLKKDPGPWSTVL